MECKVGLPTDGKIRFRCDICSLLNVYENDNCKRCQEPFDKKRKDANIVKPSNIKTKPVIVKSSNQIKLHNKNTSIKIYENNKQNKKNIKTTTKNTYKSNNNYKMKKLEKVDMSEKHLGYKAKNKSNMKTFVRSKLNHDTASYRAKFDDKNIKEKKTKIQGLKGNYATINELTRNGFQTSISKSKKPSKTDQIKTRIKNLHDERPVTPPPNKGKAKKRTLIDRLQQAHSGEIMANLRKGGRYMRPDKKDIEGGKSLYTL